MSRLASFSNAALLTQNGIVLHDDYFIFSKGSEDRAYIVFRQYMDTIDPKRIIMLDSRIKTDAMTAAELTKYNSIDEYIATNQITEIDLITLEDTNIGRALAGIPLNEESRIAMDISTMNFWEYSELLFFLLKIVRVAHIDIFYTEPDLYHYENDNIAEYNHISPNVSVNYVKSYFSTKTDDEEILVSMLGFQKSVNKLMKDLFEVTQYYSINGFPSFYPKAKDISLVNNSDYLAEIHSMNKYSAEATNPFITYNTLVDIHKASENAFMNICPLCSKPMALGACIYALMHPTSTRIVYPYPETVITKTDGVGQTYCYSIQQDFIRNE